MSRVAPFYSDAESDVYNPRELEVFHNQSRCGYGYRVRRDGRAKDGIGMTRGGYLRTLCGLCDGINQRASDPNT
jgi:hypothetical protein